MQQPDTTDIISELKAHFDHYLLESIVAFHPSFGIEQVWRSTVLAELTKARPRLYRVYPVQCPRLRVDKGKYISMNYCYAKRVWRRRMSSWEDRMRLFMEEKDEENRNAKWVHGVHYPLDSWEETKNRWKYHWNIFRYLPIAFDDRYNVE